MLRISKRITRSRVIKPPAFGVDGLSSLRLISKELIERGKSPDTPFAVVSAGTFKSEVVISGTLSTIVDMVEHANPPSPALLIMGEVIRSRFQVDAALASLNCAVPRLAG